MTKQEIKGKETAPAKKRSQARDTWRRFRNNKLAMVGLVIVLVIVLSAVFADLIAPYDYDKQSYEDRLPAPLCWSIPSARTTMAATCSAASSLVAGSLCWSPFWAW